MFSRKTTVALATAALFGLFVFNACAQWTPGGTVINLGGFELGSPASAESVSTKPYMIGNQPANSLSSDNLTMNSSTMNSSTMDNSTMDSSQPTVLPIADLSGYGKDRRDGNLKGYTNIMYPLAESAGFTASTATGGGSGGGCGC
ncbi:MAG TPA: hypothetical protein VLB04_12825 [Methanotrichaceae archaeon]|nr:hypothetical protein [Methanotrichaceae archaeon]